MNEKKVVRRRVLIGLEIVCIVLIACLVGAGFALYSLQMRDKDNTITNLTNTVNLAKSSVWVYNQTISQSEDSWTNWTIRANYAGYISVHFYRSNIFNPSAKVVYSYHGINYNQTLEGTTEVFPVMPTNIEISVGNGPHATFYPIGNWTLPIVIVNETVTITYYY
jgi:hypothetical protein